MRTPVASADDTCPRCGGAFHCGVNDSTPCPCRHIVLVPELTAALRLQFDACLCLRCLAELQAQAGEPLA